MPTRYPKPPFPDQPQSVPGVTGAMDPKPDHGETSYEGRARLLGKRALITGGDSGMGRAAAIAMPVRAATLPSIICRPKSPMRRK